MPTLGQEKCYEDCFGLPSLKGIGIPNLKGIGIPKF